LPDPPFSGLPLDRKNLTVILHADNALRRPEMLMRVRQRNNEVEIQFSRLAGRHHAVLEVLSGSTAVSEPTFEREKLESLSVRARTDAMHVRLRTRSGEPFDVTQLYRCLRRALVERQRELTPTLAA